MSLVKLAAIREPGYPPGTPAPCFFHCPCGEKVPAFQGDQTCKCGARYDERGWGGLSTDYEQVGKDAFERGEPRIVPQDILIGDNPQVGAGSGLINSQAWYRGWDAANLAAPWDDQS